MTVNVIRAFDAFIGDVSIWYIRRSRRRFWKGDDTALRTLWWALVPAVGPRPPVPGPATTCVDLLGPAPTAATASTSSRPATAAPCRRHRPSPPDMLPGPSLRLDPAP